MKIEVAHTGRCLTALFLVAASASSAFASSGSGDLDDIIGESVAPVPAPYLVVSLGLLLLLFCLKPLWRRLDELDLSYLACGVAGALFVYMLWPTGRHFVEGHELIYFEILRGIEPVMEHHRHGPWVSVPPLRLWAWLLGWVPGDGWQLLLSATLCGGTVAGIGGMLARRLAGHPWAGLVTVLLLLCEPQMVAWRHTGYHVIFPVMFLALAWLSAHESLLEDGNVRLAFAAGLSMALAACLRLDTLVFAPLLLWLVVAGRPAGSRWMGAALAAIGSGVPLLFLATRELGDVTAVWSPEQTVRILWGNLGWSHPWAPWGEPLALLGLAGLLLLAARCLELPRFLEPPRLLVLFLGLLVAHVGASTFLDLGPRHLLPGRLFLAVLAGVAWSSAPRWPGALAGALLVVGLTGETLETRNRYYAGLAAPVYEEVPRAQVALDPLVEAGCLFLSNHDVVYYGSQRDQDLVAQHLEFFDLGMVQRLWRRHGGCIIWLRGPDDRQWTSLGVRPRAEKLEHMWRWEALGWLELAGGIPGSVHRMVGPEVPPLDFPATGDLILQRALNSVPASSFQDQ